MEGRIYVGFTCDLQKRLIQPFRKKKPTKVFIPWILMYTMEVYGRANARAKEVYLKSGCGKEFLKAWVPKFSGFLPVGK